MTRKEVLNSYNLCNSRQIFDLLKSGACGASNGGVVKQRVSVYASKRLNGRNFRQFWWLIAASWFLAACSLLNRNPVLGDTAALQGQAVVTCSTACAERGQCGTIPDGGQVVLGSQIGPVLANHERMFPAGSMVTILESREQMVETVMTLEQFPLRFYHIQPADRVDGWVAGWCLAAQ